MTIRVAPESGYDFGNKRQYRRNVWSSFRRFTGSATYRCEALLMPSAEGDEVDVALSKGFREEHLHLVDRNPAIVAHLKRRYPKANCYGVSVDRAAERIARSGRYLTLANLDLCGNVSEGSPTEGVVERFVASGVMHIQSWVAITVLRGRERDVEPISWRLNLYPGAEPKTDSDQWRVVKLMGLLDGLPVKGPSHGYCSLLVRHGTYRSSAGTQTMLWTIFGLIGNVLHEGFPDGSFMSEQKAFLKQRAQVNDARLAGVLVE